MEPTKSNGGNGDKQNRGSIENLTVTSYKGASSSKPEDKQTGVTASKLNCLHLVKKLSGAARRKLRKDRREQTDTGSRRQPGREAPPDTGGTGTFKKNRTFGDTPPTDKHLGKRLKGSAEPLVKYREVVAAHKMAIIPERYPELRLVKPQIKGILKELLRKVDAIPDGGLLPLLRTYTLTDGALIYYCENEATCKWLGENLDGFKLKEDLLIKVVEAKELRKPVKVAFRTQDNMTEDSQAVLRRLKRFNPGLSTERWKVLNRQADSVGQRLIMLVDQESAEAIKKANFEAYTGLDRGIFKILTDPSTAGKAEQKETEGTKSVETRGSEERSETERTTTSDAMETQVSDK